MKNNTKRQRADNISGLLGEREMHVDYLQGYFLARPAAIPPQINETAVRMIRESEKPYIFVGGGAVLSEASKELYEFVKKVDCLLYTSDAADD